MGKVICRMVGRMLGAARLQNDASIVPYKLVAMFMADFKVSLRRDEVIPPYRTMADIDKYKIGFIISFSVNDKTYHEQILTPDCEFIFAPYIYIYLYDDIHQAPNTWYSHLLPEEVNDNTIYSSIKLFKAQEASNITSPITLSVFTYDKDDFDNNHNYIGSSIYTTTINIQ